MKRTLKFLVTVIAVFICTMVIRPMDVKAAKETDYAEVFTGSHDEEGADKVFARGNYYFKYSLDYGYDEIRQKYGISKVHFYISEDGFRFRELPENAGETIFCDANGSKYLYYINDNVLYRYYLKNGIAKYAKLKEINVKVNGTNPVFYINMFYGNNIYITGNAWDAWKVNTYVYNIKTKKFKLCEENCVIISNNGKYVVTKNPIRTDASVIARSLYKFTTSGMKVVKRVEKAYNAKIIGSYFYYTSYNDDKGSLDLYKCKLNGTNKKLIKRVKHPAYGPMQEITSKYCIYGVNYTDKIVYYKYTYKTKKMKIVDVLK